MPLTLIKAPSMIMFATLIVPIFSASSLVGTDTISMSPRAEETSTMEEFTRINPPDWRMLWNRAKDGWFMATINSGSDATGDAISSSPTATVQFAVPPLTSTP